MSAAEDKRVRCTKCSNEHLESERVRADEDEYEKKGCTPLVCPQCGHNVWEDA